VNRIGSICKTDLGGGGDLDGIFMTFIKKKIECAKEGTLKFSFDNLVAVSLYILHFQIKLHFFFKFKNRSSARNPKFLNILSKI